MMARMSEEGRRFTVNDRRWRELLRICLQDKDASEVVKIDKMLEKLEECGDSLELILQVKNEKKNFLQYSIRTF